MLKEIKKLSFLFIRLKINKLILFKFIYLKTSMKQR